jgi:hypothetical protein
MEDQPVTPAHLQRSSSSSLVEMQRKLAQLLQQVISTAQLLVTGLLRYASAA